MSAETRSRIMSRIRGKDTKPEVALRSALHRLGVRFRKHDRSLPGTPDVSHKGARVAVFVDGCFWHGCPTHFRMPKSNQDYWLKKRAYVDDLRRRTKAELAADGFLVWEVFECEIKQEALRCAGRIAEAIDARRTTLQ